MRNLQVVFIQEGRERTLLEQAFPFEGFLNRGGVREVNVDFAVEPFKLGLAQGRVDLQVRVWDYSRRRGGDGNMALLEQKMTVDTIPPTIRALSQQNYINTGGTGLIVYQTSSDCVESGVYVNDLFFPGFPEGQREGFHACYFAIPLEIQDMPKIDLWAKDRAGNVTRSGFPCRVRKKDFRADRITLTERFMKQVVGQFSQYPFEPNASDLDRFLRSIETCERGMRRSFMT